MNATNAAPQSPYARMVSFFQHREGSLFSPAADVFMAGGASLLCFLYMWFFVEKSADIFTWAMVTYYVAFFVNYPHFMASYLLLYKDARGSFTAFKENRKFALKLWWAGVLVPSLLILFFAYTLYAKDLGAVGYLASMMFFFVGWHYIKQIYGCIIVLSSAQKIYYTRVERWVILLPLYALWALSFIAVNLYGVTNAYYLITYTSAEIPSVFLSATKIFLILSTIIMILVLGYKFFRLRRWPPIAAVAAILSIYVWYVPAFAHPFYLYIIPFFHSLQYLLFVNAYERNKKVADAESIILEDKKSSTTLNLFAELTGAGTRLFIILPLVVIGTLLYAPPNVTIDSLLGRWFGNLSALSSYGALMTTLCVLGALTLAYYLRERAKTRPAERTISFFFATFLLGIIFFAVLPTLFDILARNRILPDIFNSFTMVTGAPVYLFFFTVLINIHHYFIDNVIWKSDNPHIRAHLFAPKKT